jgi:phosphoglucosamine mutase
MGKLFGTDGIRGIVGENLTVELAFHVGQAVAAVLTEEKGSKPTITIGKDTRISSDMLEAALMAGICSVGGDVMPLGTIPTPAVAYLTVLEQADAGIVISASHNPYEHNGIKVFNARGYKLSDESEARVEELILSGAPMDVKTHGEIGKRLHGMRQMKRDYIDHLISSIDCDLSGLRVLVDCANGAASATAPDLFDGLPLHADFIHREPDGVNINDGCGSTHLEDLAAAVVRGGYDIGVAFDGDADRCLAVDNQGNLVDGDFVMAICALDMKSRGKLAKNTVVGTIMTNMGFIRFCEENGMNFVATKVGDRYVLEEMLLEEYSFGGEQSGHVIFLDFGTTGDGQLTAAQLISILKRRQAKLSSLATLMERYPQVMVNVRVSPEGKLRFYTDADVKAATEQAKAVLGKTGRIVVRVSGTEPLIRVMVEGEQEETINRLANEVADVIREKLV